MKVVFILLLPWLGATDAGVGEYGLPVGMAYMRGLPDGGMELRHAQKAPDGDKILKEEIRQVIDAHRREIATCYQQALKAERGLTGKLRVRFTVDPDGKVSASEVTERTTSNRQLSDCLLRSLSGWQFPKPRGGTPAVVTFPFIFKQS